MTTGSINKIKIDKEILGDFKGIYSSRFGEVTSDISCSLELNEDTVFVYIVSGSGKIEVDGTRVTVKEKELLLLKSGFSIIGDKELAAKLIFLNNSEPYLKKLTKINLGTSFSFLFEGFYLELLASYDGRNIYSHSALVYGFVMSCINLSKMGSSKDKLVAETIEIIQKEFATIGSIGEIAESLGITKYHLIRRFSEKLGVSPGRYLEITRLERGVLLLRSTKYSLEDVANMIGYSNGNYFGKVFKKNHGITPNEYREAHKNTEISGEDEDLLDVIEGLYLV